MPLQNRVTPWGAIEADPARGTLTGNRGILHDEHKRIRRLWAGRAWICCTLDWKGLRRVPMAGRSWTELFFLDEATAMAAGHRPCALCRREDWQRFTAAWNAAGLPDDGEAPRAPMIDAKLHTARLGPDRRQRRDTVRLSELPEGCMVRPPWAEAGQEVAALVLGGVLLPWSHAGYGAPRPADPEALVLALTPAPLRAVIAAGYRPRLHASTSTV